MTSSTVPPNGGPEAQEPIDVQQELATLSQEVDAFDAESGREALNALRERISALERHRTSHPDAFDADAAAALDAVRQAWDAKEEAMDHEESLEDFLSGVSSNTHENVNDTGVLADSGGGLDGDSEEGPEEIVLSEEELTEVFLASAEPPILAILTGPAGARAWAVIRVALLSGVPLTEADLSGIPSSDPVELLRLVEALRASVLSWRDAMPLLLGDQNEACFSAAQALQEHLAASVAEDLDDADDDDADDEDADADDDEGSDLDDRVDALLAEFEAAWRLAHGDLLPLPSDFRAWLRRNANVEARDVAAIVANAADRHSDRLYEAETVDEDEEEEHPPVVSHASQSPSALPATTPASTNKVKALPTKDQAQKTHEALLEHMYPSQRVIWEIILNKRKGGPNRKVATLAPLKDLHVHGKEDKKGEHKGEHGHGDHKEEKKDPHAHDEKKKDDHGADKKKDDHGGDKKKDDKEHPEAKKSDHGHAEPKKAH